MRVTSNRFRTMRPFPPLRGTEYELVTRKLTWREGRVFYHDSAGVIKSFLTNVTDLLAEDAFWHVSAGRSASRGRSAGTAPSHQSPGAA